MRQCCATRTSSRSTRWDATSSVFHRQRVRRRDRPVGLGGPDTPDPHRAAGDVCTMAEAVDYAHRQGVIHRDLKLSNIVVDDDGQPHLLDFGLAKRDAGETTLTLDGQVLGTPAYMSPEQALGQHHRVRPLSDVYSLGVVLYELLTGELPFRGHGRMVLWQVIDEEPRPPRRLDDRIPRDIETVCLKAMAKEPGRRYQSAGTLAADLHRFLQGDPIAARPQGRRLGSGGGHAVVLSSRGCCRPSR